MSSRRETRCRSCGADALTTILDLGTTPLANRLLTVEQLDEPEPTFPLVLAFCEACTLVQITETVDPEVLFADYVYLSSFSDALLEHSRRHAEDLIARRGLGPESLVVEAASNDGYLLQFFQRAGVPVLGIEPARNVAKAAQGKGVPTRPEFFTRSFAEVLAEEGVAADVFLGNNVLAHVADLNGFVAGAALLLDPGGVVELEFPYVGDLVERVEFDTIYHEHLCYFSVHAVQALFARHGLELVDVRGLPIHGGSLRVTAARQGSPAPTVGEWLETERRRGMHELGFYADFGARVRALGEELKATLARLKGEGKRICAYGASAKGSTLLNVFGIGGDVLEFVADRSTVKQGKRTPGTHLEIAPPERLLAERPDYTLLLTWNFADEILAQQAAYRSAGGKFIVPVPTVRVV